MTSPAIIPSTLPGWGVDADPKNDPTYPMRDRSQDDGPGMNWSRPPQQAQDVEVLMSIEYNRLPAVFGTSSPPSGVSGAVRRLAFRYSESQWAHWLLLMLADRINVVEGLGEDLARGKLPNLFAEMGLATEWKHNRPAFVRRVAVTAALAGLGLALLRRRSSRGRVAVRGR